MKIKQPQYNCPTGYLTTAELAEIAEIPTYEARRRLQKAGVKAVPVQTKGVTRWAWEQRAGLYAVLDK